MCIGTGLVGLPPAKVVAVQAALVSDKRLPSEPL